MPHSHSNSQALNNQGLNSQVLNSQVLNSSHKEVKEVLEEVTEGNCRVVLRAQAQLSLLVSNFVPGPEWDCDGQPETLDCRDKAGSITGGNAEGHLMYNGVLKRKTFWTSAGLQEASCKLLIAHITYIPTGTGARWGSPRLLSCSCALLWVRRQILSRNNVITKKKMYNLIVAAGSKVLMTVSHGLSQK